VKRNRFVETESYVCVSSVDVASLVCAVACRSTANHSATIWIGQSRIMWGQRNIVFHLFSSSSSPRPQAETATTIPSFTVCAVVSVVTYLDAGKSRVVMAPLMGARLSTTTNGATNANNKNDKTTTKKVGDKALSTVTAATNKFDNVVSSVVCRRRCPARRRSDGSHNNNPIRTSSCIMARGLVVSCRDDERYPRGRATGP
jgi:hypothetical protein